MTEILITDLCTAKKIAKAKCSEPNRLHARKSEAGSMGKKWGTSRTMKILRITLLILTEESPKKLA